MLNYQNSGVIDYSKKPVRIYRRNAWEFQACLAGAITAELPGGRLDAQGESPVFWAFPPTLAHGWRGQRPAERVVFHHTVVPEELERLVPPRGYYRVVLTPTDCDRIRMLAECAYGIASRPTELAYLQTRAMAAELSLMVLCEVTPRPISSRSLAYDRTEQAMAWYRENMALAPTFREIAQAVYVSPAHLRRLFHDARGESPQATFKRMRMETAVELLSDRGLEEVAVLVGLSSGSALSRAIKAQYGLPPRELKKQRQYGSSLDDRRSVP
jgi:AraC-like DNA-binding protein